jgi:glycine/D-amino acid oxidase-like deaminating enzyme
VAALVEPRGGKLNPLSYARGLARAAQAAGAVVSPRSPVTALAREGAAWLVKTAQAEVSAGKVLLATNGYTGDLWPSLKQTIIPVASFIIATRPLSDNVRRSILRDGHVISDTRRMLTYSRLDPEGRLVVGARGKWADPMGVADFAHVKKTLQDLFPQVGDVGEPEFWWSGRVAITPDYLPHVHEPEPGLTMLLGFNGRGVAMATAMGAAAGRYLASGRSRTICRCHQPASSRYRFMGRGGCMWRLRLPGTGCWTASTFEQLLPVVVTGCGKGFEAKRRPSP